MLREEWTESQGGFLVGVGNLIRDDRSGFSLAPYVDGDLELDVQRQLKLPVRGLDTHAYRVHISLMEPVGGCCGGDDQPEVIETNQGDPFLVDPGQWINDVVTMRVPCIPGQYKVRITIEEFREKSERRPVDRWVPVARSTYFVKTS